MKFLQLTFLLFCIATSVNLDAQNMITGKVVDQNKDAIFFATVGLYQQADTILAKAIATEDNGSFTLNNVKDGKYFLEVTMLGYDNQVITDLEFPRDNNKEIAVRLEESTSLIEGVEIKARVPLLEQKSDRLVVNVANNVTSLNGSLLDVMKKVPGMIVTGDKLRMAGQSNITILINGKSTRYMDVESLLRDMPGDNIQKVEVIHQPGAEFEASGTGPIINIILKKNSLYGTNGSATVGVGKGNNWKYKTSLNLSHYQGNVNINGGVGYRNSPWYEELILRRVVRGDVYDQVGIDPNFSATFRSNLSVDWNITDKHRLGISTRYKSNSRDNLVMNSTNIDYLDPLEDDIMLRTENKSDKGWKLVSFNPYYTFDIDSNGQKLEVDFSYANFVRDGQTTLSNTVQNIDFNFPGQQFLQDGDTHITAAKIDYSLPINNNLKFQLGGKYSLADLDNGFEQLDENEDGDFVKNEMQSNRFLFKETIAAAYAKSSWTYQKWSGTAGLRYEDSYSEGQSVGVDTVLDRTIKQLFPSFSIGREISGPLAASVAYSYRIDRPNYSSLNPFRFYLDPFTFNAGNPMLRPALTHSWKFNLSYDKQPFFNIEYKEAKDAMVDVLQQNDETGQTNQVVLNLESYKVFNTSLYFPLDFIPRISGVGGIIANHALYESELSNDYFERSRWSITTFLQTTFTLPGDIDSEISGWYNSGEIDGIITGEYLYGIDMGFSKKILNNKGKISLGVENLFYRPFHGQVNYGTIDLGVISKWDAPVVSAQFSYKFGNQHMKKKDRAGGSGNDMINRAAQ